MATYESWKARVEKELEKRVGCCSLDLPDWGYRDAFDDGVSPSEAAEEAINEAGGF